MANELFRVDNGYGFGSSNGNITASNVLTITANTVALGSNANVSITGGTSGQALTTDGAGNLSWTTIGGGSSISNGTSSIGIASAGAAIVANANGVLVAGFADDSGNGNGVFYTIGNSGISTHSLVANNISLSSISNLDIGGGTSGQVITTDGAGNLSWTTASGGSSNVIYSAIANIPNANIKLQAGNESYDPGNGNIQHYAYTSWLFTNPDGSNTGLGGISAYQNTSNANGNFTTSMYIDIGEIYLGAFSNKGSGGAFLYGQVSTNINSDGYVQIYTPNLVLPDPEVISMGTAGPGELLGYDDVTGKLKWVAPGAATSLNTGPSANFTIEGSLYSNYVYANIQNKEITAWYVGTTGNGTPTRGMYVSGSIDIAEVPGEFNSGELNAPYITAGSSLIGPGNVYFNYASNVQLGNVANIHIDGGTSGQVLTTNGNGDLSWTTVSGGGSYGDSNVVTLLGSFGSNTITTTGNVSVGNITATNLGNISTININGNASTVLYGNGVFAAAPGGGGASNVIYATNANVANANIKLTAGADGYDPGDGSTLYTYSINSTFTKPDDSGEFLLSISAGQAVANGPYNTSLYSTLGEINLITQNSTGSGQVYIYGDTSIQLLSANLSLPNPSSISMGSANAGEMLGYDDATGKLKWVTSGAATSVNTGGSANFTIQGALFDTRAYANVNGNNITEWVTQQQGPNFYRAMLVQGQLRVYEVSGEAQTGTLIAPYITAQNRLSTDFSANVDFTLASNVALGAVGNIKITGGSSSQVLETDGSGNIGWTSGVMRRAFGLVASNTAVTLNDLSASVTSSNQLKLQTSGSWQGTGWTETFTSGTPSVSTWVNLPLNTGFDTASGAMNSQGHGCRCVIGDQTPSAKMYQVTVLRLATSGSQWSITIERMV